MPTHVQHACSAAIGHQARLPRIPFACSGCWPMHLAALAVAAPSLPCILVSHLPDGALLACLLAHMHVRATCGNPAAAAAAGWQRLSKLLGLLPPYCRQAWWACCPQHGTAQPHLTKCGAPARAMQAPGSCSCSSQELGRTAAQHGGGSRHDRDDHDLASP